MDLDTLDKHLRISLRLLSVVAVLAITGYFIWFGAVLEEPLSPDTGTWGAFGDFLGGLLNPLVAACALYWLTMSVRLQKTELSDTRKALVASQVAQEKQARIALLSARIESINIRLSVVSGELNYRREKRHLYIQFANTGDHIRRAISDQATLVDPLTVIKSEADRIEFLEQQVFVLTDQLNEVLHTAEKESY